MAALESALATARAHLLHARDKLAQPPLRSFQDAFLEALRAPYDAAALVHATVNGSIGSVASEVETRWRRADLRDFLGAFFPLYAQQPSAFTALCASISSAERPSTQGKEGEADTAAMESEYVLVGFSDLKRALERQFCSTRLVAKDPFPLEPCMEPKLVERRPSVAPFVTGASSGSNSAMAVDEVMSLPELHEFQADVLKKSQSWLGRWRARHLVLRWGVLEMHKRSLAARASFRHGLSSSNSSSSVTSVGSRAGEGAGLASPTVPTTGATTKTTKLFALRDLVSLQLEQLSDNEAASVRKSALTLQFQTPLTPSSNSHSNVTTTSSHEVKTLVLGGGGGEASDMLVAIRDNVATFALFLELSRRDRAPSVSKVRRFLVAGAQVNVCSRIPRMPSPREHREVSRRRSRAGSLPPHGALTALQLAFLQDPREVDFESTLALLLRAGADPCSLLHWDYATQVFFPPPPPESSPDSQGKSGEKEEEQQVQVLRKELLLRDKIGADDGAVFSCGEVQADDGARWNLLMYFCWDGDLESVQRLLTVTGMIGSQGAQGRTSGRQLLRCLDHVNAAGDTALHVAIKTSSEDVALLLVEAALSANAQAVHRCDARGEPVAHLALAMRHWRVVDALVAGGAVDPRSYDNLGNTALHFAIQVRAPVALVARLIQVYRRAPPTGGLESRAGRRGGNDTPLSLALKCGQQEVVALLLASGASSAVLGCEWSTAFSNKREEPNGQESGARGVIGKDDSALHVSIKAGMELAAAALIAHNADISAVDSQGASPLALAVRYGLYALAATLAEQHKKRQHQSSDRSPWVDCETGRPVAMLAVQAGQLELAALLLDCGSDDKDDDRRICSARLLPLLVQVSSWLETSVNQDLTLPSDSRGSDEDGPSGKFDDSKKVRSSSTSSSSSTWTRDRVKSRSDGDWAHLRREASRQSGGKVPAAISPLHEEPGISNARVKAKIQEERIACVFLLHGIQALVVRFLQLSQKSAVAEVVGGGSTSPYVSLSTLPLVVHLPTTTAASTAPPVILKDDELTASSPLHIAASGSPATSGLLRLLLAFLLNADPSAAAQILVQTMGPRAETPLHVALAVGAAENALLLLYASRELQARDDMASSICAQFYEIPNSQGDSALHLASAWPRSVAMRLVVELLLQELVYAGSWNNAGLTPLHVALHRDCDDAFIELFVRYGQDLNLWTEGSRYEDGGKEDERGEFFAENGTRTSAVALMSSCPQSPLTLAVEFENTVAFRALVRAGAQARVLMPRARVGLLQLALHCNTCDPELLGCLLDNAELERSARSDVADQWGVTPREARSRLMEIWRRERSGNDTTRLMDTRSVAVEGKDAVQPQESREIQPQQKLKQESQHPHPPLHPVAASIRQTTLSQSTTGVLPPTETEAPPPLLVKIPHPAPLPVPVETVQYLRALPRPPNLAQATLEYLREEERATLTLVAQEARREAKDWLAKRIGQKKLLSDAHAQLQSAQKHKRSASGSSVISIKDDADPRRPKVSSDVVVVPVSGASVSSGSEGESDQQQLLEELKASVAKKFIDKHVAEAVAEARLAIEREKQTIFQETGLYPGLTSTSKKNKKKDGGRHRSLLVRAASSTTGSILLPASSASVASMPRAEGNATQLSDDSGGNASFWWSERGTTFLSDDINLTWLSTSGPRGGTMLSDSTGVGGGSTWLSTGRGTMLDAKDDRRLSFSARSFLESEDSDNLNEGSRGDASFYSDRTMVGSVDRGQSRGDRESDAEYANPLDRPSFAHIISERNTMA
ncbi:hypothetical protein BBJ28_00008607 [Nothophytophthora sp. Chile5]|nr:hypothetical protein BBJ28_00008607 [Nothophytophthora sp. Chile5]